MFFPGRAYVGAMPFFRIIDLSRFWPACRSQESPEWSMWPFGPGYSEGWLVTVTKFLFIAAVFGAICLFLRFLFGPGGRLRPKEFGVGHIEERKRKKRAVAELRRRRKNREITAVEFFERRKRIMDE